MLDILAQVQLEFQFKLVFFYLKLNPRKYQSKPNSTGIGWGLVELSTLKPHPYN